MKEIIIKNAKENNLKNLCLTIPRDKLVLFTGISGSGKSSLAFDTIFAEGQRRYIESLSAYARQFLGQMEKPDVESIEGLSPAISIDQKTTSNNPRSTVGTVTEIYDYLRLLYARIGTPYCPNCGKEIARQTVDQIADKIMEMGEGAKIQILAPVVRSRKGEYRSLIENLKKQGYARVRVDGQNYTLEEEIDLDKQKKHSISVVVDRIVVKQGIQQRLFDSLETAIKLAEGLVVVLNNDGEEILFSTKYACPDCNIAIEELEPRMFSFNSPFGACPDCLGLGFMQRFNEDLVLPDKTKSLSQGAIRLMGFNVDAGSRMEGYLRALSRHYGFSMDTPVQDLPQSILNLIMYGNGDEKVVFEYTTNSFSGKFNTSWEGVIPMMERRYKESTSDYAKREYEKFMVSTPCKTCGGKRLKKEILSVKIANKNIWDICELPMSALRDFFNELVLTPTKATIARLLLNEIKARINFLCDVGLDYLTLNRSSSSLSGGEAQRIRLATQIGSGLTGVLYILDEPSIGLHQRDNNKLIETLKGLRDKGNTVIVVEHDEDTIRSADYVVDIGPGAGIHGGQVVACGTPQDIMDCDESITGQYLSGKRFIPVPKERRSPDGRFLTVVGATKNNLKNITANIPVGLLTVVTGVSGSGKSSLVNEILAPQLLNKLNRTNAKPIDCQIIKGIEHFDNAIVIDQSPIGRTPRSNPATYTGMFDHIRKLYAMTNDAKERGYSAGRFSFNVSGGRCENCNGDGILRIEMNFLPDVFVPCEVCHGKRYNRETLQVKYKGKNIADVLDMRVEEALAFFENITPIKNKLQTLFDVGLGYIKLGQPATSLSGGEAQRVKLSTELSKRNTGKTVYLLDEPTTGLATADVDRLIKILQTLVAKG
ncbi:MAG: excinuclease ABC subunit UvrA, partial [Clostridia bacterium]|nr:excinuclease ABC subunit UvrA [Clostridia bacterium]